MTIFLPMPALIAICLLCCLGLYGACRLASDLLNLSVQPPRSVPSPPVVPRQAEPLPTFAEAPAPLDPLSGISFKIVQYMFCSGRSTDPTEVKVDLDGWIFFEGPCMVGEDPSVEAYLAHNYPGPIAEVVNYFHLQPGGLVAINGATVTIDDEHGRMSLYRPGEAVPEQAINLPRRPVSV